MKEIIINGRYLTQPLTGVQRYAHEVVKAFDDLLNRNEIDRDQYKIILAVPPEVKKLPELEHIKIKQIGKLKNNLWEQFSLPIFSRGKTLFNPCNSGPILGGKKQVITIHDASVFAIPEAYKFLFRLKHKLIIFVMGRNAAKIITDSMFSKLELAKFGKIDESHIQVIPLGCEHISKAVDTDENIHSLVDISQPYILSVGSQSKHKNVAALIKAMEYINYDEINLLVTGGVYSKVFTAKTNETKPWLHHLGYVSDSQLKQLYEHALCFVYPSYYEGFGLPPLEAMSCGCPVLVSNAGSLPEICGEGALYFSPFRPEQIAEKISLIIENSSEREKLIHNGYEQIKKYNWIKTARELISMIAED